MLLPSHIWALPPSLLLLIASFTSPTISQDLSHSVLLPRDVKYFPEHVAIARREQDIQQRLQRERPVGMRKMSGDPGEKFHLNYWLFEEDVQIYSNESLVMPFANSFPLHSDHHVSSIAPRYLDLRRLSLFTKRDYQCPYGTNACTSINRPNSCCAAGSTCQIIYDTGLGDVGCCPAEETCSGSVSDCGDGYTPCPNNPGGGCCVPGYGCYETGCVQTATQVINPAPTYQVGTTTVTELTTITASGGGLRTLTTTVIVPGVTYPTTSDSPTPLPPPPSTSSYEPSTVTSVVTTHTTATRSTSYSCPYDFRSCPASLGGGCCHTDRACGSGRLCPARYSSGSIYPPVRPTDDSTTLSYSSISGVGCPTGYYACSAYYEGGCCQIDRNCDKTSCPTLASTTLVSNPPTIVAPTGSGITAPGNLLTGALCEWVVYVCAG